MSKAEEYIALASDEIGQLCDTKALRAVEIARKEVMDEVCDYIKNNLYKYLYVYDGQAGFPTHQFINDLKQAMRDE